MYNEETDKEAMLRKIMQSSQMVDPSQMAGMTAGNGQIDNTGATIDALTQAQTPDPAFLQAQQNAQSDLAAQGRKDQLMALSGAAGGMAFNPGIPDMGGLQRGGGLMSMQAAPDLSGSSSSPDFAALMGGNEVDIMGLLNSFK